MKVGWAGVTGIMMGDPAIDRTAAALEAFGYDNDPMHPGDGLPECVSENYSTLIKDYLPIAGTSYAVWGMSILDNVAEYNCAREVMSALAVE